MISRFLPALALIACFAILAPVSAQTATKTYELKCENGACKWVEVAALSPVSPPKTNLPPMKLSAPSPNCKCDPPCQCGLPKNFGRVPQQLPTSAYGDFVIDDSGSGGGGGQAISQPQSYQRDGIVRRILRPFRRGNASYAPNYGTVNYNGSMTNYGAPTMSRPRLFGRQRGGGCCGG